MPETLNAAKRAEITRFRQNSKHITKFELKNCELLPEQITDIANALKHNTYVTELSLICTYIGDEGLVELATGLESNKTLKKLSLFGNDITDEGVEHLLNTLKNKSLEELNLTENDITNNGAIKIAEMLKHNKDLKELHLDSNKIRDQGAIALFSSNIETLGFSYNKLSEEAIKKVFELLSLNKTLKHSSLIKCTPFSENIHNLILKMLNSNMTIINLTIYDTDLSYSDENLEDSEVEKLQNDINEILDANDRIREKIKQESNPFNKYALTLKEVKDTNSGEMKKITTNMSEIPNLREISFFNVNKNIEQGYYLENSLSNTNQGNDLTTSTKEKRALSEEIEELQHVQVNI